MEKIDLLNIEGIDGKLLQYVRIDHGNEEYTTMLKSFYDEQQAQQVEHLTEISTGAKEL
jgi:hypothetical protein